MYKIVLYVMILIITLQGTTALINDTNLAWNWELTNSDNTLIDNVTGITADKNGTPTYRTTNHNVFPGAMGFATSDAWHTNVYGINGTNARAIEFWINLSTYVANDDFFSYGTYSAHQYMGLQHGQSDPANNNDIWIASHTSNANYESNGGNMYNGSFHHIIINFPNNPTHNTVTVFVNGVRSTQRESSSGTINTGTDKEVAIGYDIANTAFMDAGDIQLVRVWNKELTYGSVAEGVTATGEVAELYNSGMGLSYYNLSDNGIGSPGIPEQNITVTAKDWWDGHETINIFNVTINGTKYNTTTGQINTTLSNATNALFNFTFESAGFNDRTYTNVNITRGTIQGNLTNSTTQQGKILALDHNGNIMTNVNILLQKEDNTTESSTSNPMSYTLSDYLNETDTDENITINITDNTGYYISNSTTVGISTTTRNVTINMTPNKLTLTFTSNVPEGLILDLNRTRNFSQAQFVIVQQNLTIGKVLVLLKANQSWGNYTQYYEYWNDYETNVNTTIDIMDKNIFPPNEAWFKVVDDGDSPVKGATVEMFFRNTSSADDVWLLIGQRYTEADGLAMFKYPEFIEMKVMWTKEGFNAKWHTFPSTDIWSNTGADNPKKLVFDESDYPIRNGISLFMYNGFKYYDTAPEIMRGAIWTKRTGTISVNTDWGSNNGFSAQKLTKDKFNRYLFNLTKLQQYDNNTLTDITLRVYIDDVEINTYTIDYINRTRQNILNIPETMNTMLLPLLFIITIILSGVIGMKMNSTTAGAGTFFMGTIMLSFLNTAFIWLGLVTMIIYGGRKLYEMYYGE